MRRAVILFDNDCGHTSSVVADVSTEEVTNFALELFVSKRLSEIQPDSSHG